MHVTMMREALFTDLYELTMMQAYVEEGMLAEAIFDLHVRSLPTTRNYLLACGLDDVLTYLETVRFGGEPIDYLRSLGTFRPRFLDYLREFRFTGDVHAVLEGTPIFPFEPLVEIVAPLPEAQLLETFVINQIGLQTVLASKAARVVAAAQGRAVVDFGCRRAQGLDAGIKGARAFHIAGVSATSNLAAGQQYAIPVAGTMAHSYIQAHDDEEKAFRAFAGLYPGTTLLVDTYDSLDGVKRVVHLAQTLGPAFRVGAIRLDSGDLADLAVRSRRILDEAGLSSVRIFASGGLDEVRVAALVECGAPIDAFGVGTEMAVAGDAPSLDIVYKLVSYAGRDRIKRSPGKRVLPGRKQVFREEVDGVAMRDILASAGETHAGRPLLVPVMRGGRRLPLARESLATIHDRAVVETGRLPERLRSLAAAEPPYPVEISMTLQERHRRLAESHA
jgi:nicotinate phosphoribosyltransferase